MKEFSFFWWSIPLSVYIRREFHRLCVLKLWLIAVKRETLKQSGFQKQNSIVTYLHEFLGNLWLLFWQNCFESFAVTSEKATCDLSSVNLSYSNQCQECNNQVFQLIFFVCNTVFLPEVVKLCQFSNSDDSLS